MRVRLIRKDGTEHTPNIADNYVGDVFMLKPLPVDFSVPSTLDCSSNVLNTTVARYGRTSEISKEGYPIFRER